MRSLALPLMVVVAESSVEPPGLATLLAGIYIAHGKEDATSLGLMFGRPTRQTG